MARCLWQLYDALQECFEQGGEVNILRRRRFDGMVICMYVEESCVRSFTVVFIFVVAASPPLVFADSWKRLAAPTHYAPASAEVVQPSKASAGSAVAGAGTTTTTGTLTATATTMEADTPFFVEYPEMGTKCRVMAQSEAGLTLGNLFTIIDCNPTLKSALGVHCTMIVFYQP